MSRLSRFSCGTILAASLAAGTAMMVAGPAAADTTTRTNCLGNNCVTVHCDSDSGTCTQTTNFSVRHETTYRQDNSAAPAYTVRFRSEPAARPIRYACDAQGFNCHWTRSYFVDDFGNPVFDPGMAQ